MQNSARSRCAWASTSPSRNTTCDTPDASRRSMNMTPPWSRRRATQPARVTFCPASVVRSEPAACVRSTKTPCEWPEETTAKCRGGPTAGSLAIVGTSIALIGPGAIGATVAAYLHAAGHPVLLCGHTARESIEVRPDDHDPILLPGPVHTDPAEVDGPVDVVFVAVKDTQNEQAGAWLARLCDERTVVCALQNGVEQVDRVGRFCPSSTVVPAAVWISSEIQPDGWVRVRNRAAAGAARHRGGRDARGVVARRRGDGRAGPRLQHRRVAQAVGQLGGRHSWC